MSKPLFEFVKVSAGEPSNLPENVYTVFRQPDIHAASACLLLDGKIISYEKDHYILRPAESPDAAREGFIQWVTTRIHDEGGRIEHYMRAHWPTPARVTRKEIPKDIRLWMAKECGYGYESESEQEEEGQRQHMQSLERFYYFLYQQSLNEKK